MFKDLRKISFRNLIGEKGHTFINILSLKTGIICSLLLLLYVVNELTCGYHSNPESAYHVELRVRESAGEFTHPLKQPPLAEAVAVRERYNIPGIRENISSNTHFKLDARISLSGAPMFRLQATWGQVLVKFEGELLTLIGSTPRYAALFLIIGLIVFPVGKKRQ